MLSRGKRRLALGLFGATCGLVVWPGCSGFGDGAAPSDGACADGADGGKDALAPVTGSAVGNYDMTVDLAAVRHGIPATAKIAVTRHPPFAKKIRVDLKDPPAGITADPLVLDEQATEGQLVIHTDASVPQGPLTLTVRANVPETALLDLAVPKDVAVQGAPGELDTSFGANGMLIVPDSRTTATVLAEGTGTFFLAGVVTRGGMQLTRYVSETGAIDTTFADAGSERVTVGFYTFGGILPGADRLIVVGNTSINPGIPNIQQYSQLSRLLLNGDTDPLFHFYDTRMIAYSLAVSGTNKLALLGKANADASTQGWVVDWLDAAGTVDTTVNNLAKSTGTSPPIIERGVYTANALYAVGETTVLRLLSAGGMLDSAFGSGGTFTLPNAASTHTALRDTKDRAVIGGIGSDGGLYVARFDGARLDPSWASVGYATSGAGVSLASGRLALQADGNLVQIGTTSDGAHTHCVVVRWRDDGSLDPLFGINGTSTLPVDDCTASDLAITNDGKLLVSGPKTVRVWL